MHQSQGELRVSTRGKGGRGKGLYEMTRDVRKWAGAQNMDSGLLTAIPQPIFLSC